jgi:hypothetical protein
MKKYIIRPYHNYITEPNEELKNLYSLPNIFRVIKSRRMGWDGERT